jgi:hypothetical protein
MSKRVSLNAAQLSRVYLKANGTGGIFLVFVRKYRDRDRDEYRRWFAQGVDWRAKEVMSGEDARGRLTRLDDESVHQHKNTQLESTAIGGHSIRTPLAYRLNLRRPCRSFKRCCRSTSPHIVSENGEHLIQESQHANPESQNGKNAVMRAVLASYSAWGIHHRRLTKIKQNQMNHKNNDDENVAPKNEK